MRTYYLIHWTISNGELYLKVDAEDDEDLFRKLKEAFPEDDEILVNGINYNYIRNNAHWAAAGFPPHVCSLADALAPAHFNRNFFFIVRVDGITMEEAKEQAKKNLKQMANGKYTES